MHTCCDACEIEWLKHIKAELRWLSPGKASFLPTVFANSTTCYIEHGAALRIEWCCQLCSLLRLGREGAEQDNCGVFWNLQVTLCWTKQWVTSQVWNAFHAHIIASLTLLKNINITYSIQKTKNHRCVRSAMVSNSLPGNIKVNWMFCVRGVFLPRNRISMMEQHGHYAA